MLYMPPSCRFHRIRRQPGLNLRNSPVAILRTLILDADRTGLPNSVSDLRLGWHHMNSPSDTA